MKTRRFILLSIVFLFVVACVVPGLSQPSAPPLEMGDLPTVIVLTADAAGTQTAVVAPPTVEKPALTSVTTIEQLSDGSTKFTDNEIGLVVVFPPGWLTLRPNSEEFNSALVNDAAKNEMLRDQMELDLTDYEPGVDRLYSYPILPDIEKDFVFGFSAIEWQADDTTPVEESFMGDFIREMETSVGLPGFRTDTAMPHENPSLVKMIKVGGMFTMRNIHGAVVPFYIMSAFFKPTRGGIVMLSFAYLNDYKLAIAPDVDSAIDSIQLLIQ